jgi:hypothetical protein
MEAGRQEGRKEGKEVTSLFFFFFFFLVNLVAVRVTCNNRSVVGRERGPLRACHQIGYSIVTLSIVSRRVTTNKQRKRRRLLNLLFVGTSGLQCTSHTYTRQKLVHRRLKKHATI